MTNIRGSVLNSHVLRLDYAPSTQSVLPYDVTTNTIGSPAESGMVEYLYPYAEENAVAPGESRLIGNGWAAAIDPMEALDSPTMQAFQANVSEAVERAEERLRVFGLTRPPLELRHLLEIAPRLSVFVDEAMRDEKCASFGDTRVAESGQRRGFSRVRSFK